ncbi:MAG: sugar transferase [Bacteroidetes bacterium]|nr:sugar transferase [Bacteroidota bacterium]
MGKNSYLKSKYKIDLIAAIVMSILLLPVLIAISTILLFELKANPILIQERGLSLTNFRFKIYKFRTLKKFKFKDKTDIEDVFYKTELIDYVPRFGRWLRHTGLDELPQLINIIKGEMSFIGPRPFTVEDIEIIKEKKPDAYCIRDKIQTRPGITGSWQVFGSRKKGIENLVNLEQQYDAKISPGVDIKILLTTIPLVFRGKLSDAILDGFERKKSGKVSEAKSMINI